MLAILAEEIVHRSPLRVVPNQPMAAKRNGASYSRPIFRLA